MQNFGYIQIEFKNNFKESLLKWSKKHINSKYFIYSKLKGELIGGLVVRNAHITLVYGIPLSGKYLNEIKQEIKKIKSFKITITGLKCFYLRQYKAKILYLSIDDKNNTLNKINKRFMKFISKKFKKKYPFIPHVAIAYVSENFNEKTLVYDGPKEIMFKKIEYFKY